MAAVDATALLRPDRRVKRRRVVNRIMEGLAMLAALLAVGVLIAVVVTVVRHGISELNLDLFVKTPAGIFEPGGGLANAMAGSLVLVGVATAMALPVGVLIAIFLTELAPKGVARPIQTALDVMNGLPSIVIGLFVYSLLVAGHQQSGLAGSFALAIIALPLIARSTQEVLRLVPNSLREAGLALGSSRWRVILGVVLPTCVGGILTGTTLAVARIAGETAPLLFTSSLVTDKVVWNPLQALQALPVAIFELSESADPADNARAWAAGTVLLGAVLILSLASKWAQARTRRKLGR
jgi:phosphate transport system permease protein